MAHADFAAVKVLCARERQFHAAFLVCKQCSGVLCNNFINRTVRYFDDDHDRNRLWLLGMKAPIDVIKILLLDQRKINMITVDLLINLGLNLTIIQEIGFISL